MDTPAEVIYWGDVAPLNLCPPEQVHAVIITKERNCFVVWHGFPQASNYNINWQPAPVSPVFFGENQRDKALERGVTEALNLRKKFEKRNR